MSANRILSLAYVWQLMARGLLVFFCTSFMLPFVANATVSKGASKGRTRPSLLPGPWHYEKVLLTVKVVLRLAPGVQKMPAATVYLNYSNLGTTNKYGQFVQTSRVYKYRRYNLIIGIKGGGNQVVLSRSILVFSPKTHQPPKGGLGRDSIAVWLTVLPAGKLKLLKVKQAMPSFLPTSLTQRQVRGELRRMAHKLHACKRHMPAATKGLFSLSLRLHPKGRASRIRVTKYTDQLFITCVTKVVQAWRFPRFSGKFIDLSRMPFQL